MSQYDYFQWWRQAPFASALFKSSYTDPEKTEFLMANAVFKVVTGLSESELNVCQAEDFNRRAVYYSVNTSLHYQVQSYAPETGLLLITLQQIPRFGATAAPSQLLSASGALTSLMLDIAQQFIGATTTNLASLINETLARLGREVDADRVYIFDYDFHENTCSNTYEWCALGITPELPELQQVPIVAIPQWVSAHKQGLEMYLPDVPSLPEGDALKQLLQPQGIKSLLSIPIIEANDLRGFVGFDSVKRHHYYSEQERLLLGMFASMLMNLCKIQQE